MSDNNGITVKRYHSILHHPFILKCLGLRGLPTYEPEEMPSLGWVAFWGDTKIAALFLRRCEGNVALLDSLVTDPHQPGVLRDMANDALISHAMGEAYEMDLTRIIAFSLDKNTLERVKKHGFVHLPHTVVSLNLS